jgi:hypothetical protein
MMKSISESKQPIAGQLSPTDPEWPQILGMAHFKLPTSLLRPGGLTLRMN